MSNINLKGKFFFFILITKSYLTQSCDKSGFDCVIGSCVMPI